MWRMQALTSVTLAAGEITELQPGGRHLMLFGLRQNLLEGQQVAFRFELKDGRQVILTALVRGPGSANDSHDHH